MQFSYITNKTSKQARVCTRDDFYRLVGDPRVAELVNRFRAGEQQAKGELPAFLFHATFEGEQRGNQWAEPSGLYMLDFDHLEDPPAQVWERMQTLLPAPPVEGGEQQQSVMQRIESLGIQMVHVTPSGQGLRIVAKMLAGHEDLKTIADWQQWLYQQLTEGEELPLDTCVKDFARLSFVVPLGEFLYLNDEVFTSEAEYVVENNFGKAEDTQDKPTPTTTGVKAVKPQPVALKDVDTDLLTVYLKYHPYKPSKRHAWWVNYGQHLRYKGIAREHVSAYITFMKMQLMLCKLVESDDPINRSPNEVKEAVEWGWEHSNEAPTADEQPDEGGTEVPHSDEAGTFRYGEHLISDIAASWLVYKGMPRQGERHTFYYQMVSNFKFITDYQPEVMMAQLPDLGLTEGERWKMCDHASKVNRSQRIPYEFYKFLTDNGYKEKPSGAAQTATDEDVPEINDDDLHLPKLPPLIKELVEVAPKDFKIPVIFALFPILGTLATRLRAVASDGEEHSASATTVIYAPQSSGKSFVRRLDRILLTRLRERDEAARAKEIAYKRELEVKKNAKELPEDPHVMFRIIEGVISVPQLCTRQMDAKGLHQFTLLEELDTLTKSNKGGSWADKSDLYRVAYDNGYYGQDYKNNATFSGSVRLFYNLLICGTPRQVTRFFTDAENGLVSRVCFCEIKNRLFARRHHWKELTKSQQRTVEEIVARLDEQTYGAQDLIKPVKVVDMRWLHGPLDTWIDQKLTVSERAWSVAMDRFRWRAATNAFRYALICTQLVPALTKKTKQMITDFALWFAEQDLRNRLDLFEAQMNEGAGGKATELKNPREVLFSKLPDKFTLQQLIDMANKLSIKSDPYLIIHIWKKNGLIIKLEKNVWLKVKGG